MSVQPAPRRAALERIVTTVTAIDRPSDSLVLVRLKRPANFDFQTGQFTYVFVPESDVRRPYSIASPPHDKEGVDLCVKKVKGGPCSTYLYGLEVGDPVTISRGLGGFRFRTPPGVPVVFLATGTGIAPFRSMIHERLHAGDERPMWLLAGSREERSLPYLSEFYGLADEASNFTFVPVLSGGPLYWRGDRGWIQEALLRRFPQHSGYHAYVCGLKRMVDDVRMMLQERGLSPDAIHAERYD